MIDSRVNHLQAILRNFVDMFALSAVRFCLYIKVMPNQILTNINKQMKIVINQCHLCNHKIDSKLRDILLHYFYSVFDLFKYLCLKAYFILLKHFRGNNNFHFLKIVTSRLRRMNFENNIRVNKSAYLAQIDIMIDQQIIKFLNVDI